MSDRYNFFEKEHQIRILWEKERTYQYDPARGATFSIDTPPPTVSGTLHIGHVFSYTQTDLIARFKRMQGHAVFYPFGFDNNGLPTERFVEKKRGTAASRIGRSAFNQACLEETKEAEKGFVDLWKQMGLSVDWDYCYSTISLEVQKKSQQSFIELYKKGYIYRKQEPALFCTACRTSVAQADLEDIEKETWFCKIIFKSENNKKYEIATTRPEMLAACVAVFYHPSDTRYQHLQGEFLQVPHYDFLVLVKADDRVIPDKGTGLVMCCTFGDTLDVYWFKTHGLPYKQAINRDGTMTEITRELAGLKVEEARAKIIEILEAENLLLEKTRIKHLVSIYERSKKEIEFMMLSQWFLAILPYKKELIECADKINWHPAHMKQRYVNWVENLQWDWCLSRQRSFGVPFPVWYDSKTHSVILAEDFQLPVDPQDTRPHEYAGEAIPDADVMDTWNTSSLTPYLAQDMLARCGHDLRLPFSMRPQAHDIIRTWAFYTVVKAWMHEKTIPWKDIVISGHVVVGNKEKISKSQGNNPTEPLALLKTFPADVIRYWTASSMLGTDTAFSDTQFKNGNRLLVKLWNAAVFVKQHIGEERGNELLSAEISHPLHRWILSKLKQTYEIYTDHFNHYDYSLALAAVERLFWSDFCDNYLELIKHQLFNADAYAEGEVRETRQVLAYLYIHLLKLFAPFLSHITDFLYRELHPGASIHLSFFGMEKLVLEKELMDNFEKVLEIVSYVRKVKTEAHLSLKAEIKDLYICVEGALNEELLKQSMICLQHALSAYTIHLTKEKKDVPLQIENEQILSLSVCCK